MIKIIDYRAGNAQSVLHAVQACGFQGELCKSPAELNNATHIILPGVGSADATMRSLDETGLRKALDEYVIGNGVPFLGVCVGMQILFSFSEEGGTTCLGWLKGRVRRFDSDSVRVPQMGWNEVRFCRTVPFSATDGYFYFVNSFHAVPDSSEDIWGTADYGGRFAAAVRRGNLYGTQFHIEKSGGAGLRLLKGFLSLC